MFRRIFYWRVTVLVSFLILEALRRFSFKHLLTLFKTFKKFLTHKSYPHILIPSHTYTITNEHTHTHIPAHPQSTCTTEYPCYAWMHNWKRTHLHTYTPAHLHTWTPAHLNTIPAHPTCTHDHPQSTRANIWKTALRNVAQVSCSYTICVNEFSLPIVHWPLLRAGVCVSCGWQC